MEKNLDLNPDINLYDGDKSHPSYEGSYLGACVYFECVFKQSVTGNQFTGQLDSTSARLLQETSTHTVLDSLQIWRIEH